MTRRCGALVLLTDGETTVGRPAEVGAQEAADAGVPVTELTWRWAAIALVVRAATWALALWWLRDMV